MTNARTSAKIVMTMAATPATVWLDLSARHAETKRHTRAKATTAAITVPRTKISASAQSGQIVQ